MDLDLFLGHARQVELDEPASGRSVEIGARAPRIRSSLNLIGPCVTVLGSARFAEEHRYYSLAREVGGILARLGFTVMTGGGPGIMEAASRGAKEAGGRTVGCNILLPVEQKPNAFLDARSRSSGSGM